MKIQGPMFKGLSQISCRFYRIHLLFTPLYKIVFKKSSFLYAITNYSSKIIFLNKIQVKSTLHCLQLYLNAKGIFVLNNLLEPFQGTISIFLIFSVTISVISWPLLVLYNSIWCREYKRPELLSQSTANDKRSILV